jgi:hypothetical protein
MDGPEAVDPHRAAAKLTVASCQPRETPSRRSPGGRFATLLQFPKPSCDDSSNPVLVAAAELGRHL